jgi:hypothetical protein
MRRDARAATSIVITCWRRASRAERFWTSALGTGRGSGRTTAPHRASSWAARTAVGASCPTALAKARPWRGLPTATARPAAGRFHHDQCRGRGLQPIAEPGDSCVVIPLARLGPGGAFGEVEGRRGHVNTDEARGTQGTLLLPDDAPDAPILV